MPLFLFSCSVYMLPIVSPGSILSWYQAVRLCMNFGARVCPEMFLVGGWVLPELQQICGVQFGSGTNPGGHVTVFLVRLWFFVWMAPWSISTPPPTFQVVCEWNPLAQSDARGPRHFPFIWSPWDRCSRPGRQEEKTVTVTVIYLFWVLLNDLHWDMWYHRSFLFTVVATQLLHIALTSYGPCHRGVNAPCFTKTRTITMSPSENFTSEVGLDCVSFVKSDCCCFRAARACSPASLVIAWAQTVELQPRGAPGLLGQFLGLWQLHDSSSHEFEWTDTCGFWRSCPQYC